MSRRQAFSKYILSINITILILGFIALINIDINSAPYFILIFTMLMNTVLGLVVIIKIYMEGSKESKKRIS